MTVVLTLASAIRRLITGKDATGQAIATINRDQAPGL
jgi:hypothetical protein